MTTKIMLAQKHGDTAQPLYPATDTQAILTEGTDGATLRERLLKLENTSFQDFSSLVPRVETMENFIPPPLAIGKQIELESGIVFVCPSDGMLQLSTWGNTFYCQAELLSTEDESILQRFGASSNNGLQDCVSIFLPKGSKVRMTYKSGNEASAMFIPLASEVA